MAVSEVGTVNSVVASHLAGLHERINASKMKATRNGNEVFARMEVDQAFMDSPSKRVLKALEATKEFVAKNSEIASPSYVAMLKKETQLS